MDNFTSSIAYKSEPPLDDDSSNFLRDEIRKTQNFFLGKLDEQRIAEEEMEQQVEENIAKAQAQAAQISSASQKLRDLEGHLVNVQNSCRTQEMRLVSIKNNLPNSIKKNTENTENSLEETKIDLAKFQNVLSIQQEAIRKIQTNSENPKAEERKRQCKDLRKVILEAKKKSEKMISLQNDLAKLKADYEEKVARQNSDEEALNRKRANLEKEKEETENLAEKCVELRAELVQLEAGISQNPSNVDLNKILLLESETGKIRDENSELLSNSEALKIEKDGIQKSLNDLRDSRRKNEELIETRKQEILSVLRQKIEEKNAGKSAETKKIAELKKSINRETMKLEKAKKKLVEVTPTDVSSVAGLKKEIKSMTAEIRNFDKFIREATAQNNELVDEIAKFREPSEPSVQQNLDETIELTENFEKSIVPSPVVAVTPIQRQISHDVFTGLPLMTSTPLNAKAVESVRTTRAAARRLETRAKAKTTEFRKKRGKK